MIVSDYSKVEEEERLWHQRHAVWRADKAGAATLDIARILGVRPTDVRFMCDQADLEVRHKSCSPLTRELSQVEIVSFAQLRSGLWRRLLDQRHAEISELTRSVSWYKAKNAELNSQLDGLCQHRDAKAREKSG